MSEEDIENLIQSLEKAKLEFLYFRAGVELQERDSALKSWINEMEKESE